MRRYLLCFLRTSWRIRFHSSPEQSRGTTQHTLFHHPIAHQPGKKRLQGWSTTEPSPSTASDRGWTATPAPESRLDPEPGKCSLASIQHLGCFPEINQLQGQGLKKMKPGTGPGLFFRSTTPKPNTQDTTNPTLRSTSRVTAGTTHLWFMCVPVWCNSPFDGHLPQIRPTCA